MRFTIYQESRQGGRANNEDRTSYCYSREALLMVIADGMGGHHYGEIAAQIAVQTLADSFQREARPTLVDPFRFLQKGMTNAHHSILDYAERHRLDDSPRTTCVACIVQDNVAYWAHAGDSRLFLIRGGKVIAQTKDHSRFQLLMEEGCSVCYRNFGSNLVPMVLLCGHSFCAQCSEMVRSCPLCRQRIPNSFQRPTNFALLSLLEKVERTTTHESAQQPVQIEEPANNPSRRTRETTQTTFLDSKVVSINMRKTGIRFTIK